MAHEMLRTSEGIVTHGTLMRPAFWTRSFIFLSGRAYTAVRAHGMMTSAHFEQDLICVVGPISFLKADRAAIIVMK